MHYGKSDVENELNCKTYRKRYVQEYLTLPSLSKNNLVSENSKKKKNYQNHFFVHRSSMTI